MTETIQQLKEDIAILQEKLQKLEEIEKQPRMNLQQESEYAVVSYHDKVYYRLMGETTFSWYIKKGVSANHRVPTLVMVEDAETERLLEGLYYNHIQVKKEKVSEEPEENEWKSVALRFGEKLSGYLSDGYYELSPNAWFRWAVFTYGKGQQIKETVRESVKWCEEHPDKDPLDWVKSRDDLIDKMVAELKGKTLTDIIWKWWEDVFTTHSDWDAENSIEDLVNRIEQWLPKEQSAAGSQNAYVECTVEGFNDAIQKIKRKLR